MFIRIIFLVLFLSGCTHSEPHKPFTCEILNRATSDLHHSMELTDKALGSLLVIARDREDLRMCTLNKLCMYYPARMPGTDTKTCGVKDINDFLEQLKESRSSSLQQLATYNQQISEIRTYESKNLQFGEVVGLVQYLKSIISFGVILFFLSFLLKLITGQSNLVDLIKVFKKK